MLTLLNCGQANPTATPKDSYIITVKTDNTGTSADNQFIFQTSASTPGTYDIETSEESFVGRTGNTTLTWAVAGTYEVKIKNTNNIHIYYNNKADKLKLLEINQWGNLDHSSSWSGAFRGCANMNITATDSPVFKSNTSLYNAFRDCSSLNADLSGWDTSNVVSTRVAFYNCSAFNGNITTWDMSSVTDMQQMFAESTNFNQDISGWNTSSVTNMLSVFALCTNFNQDLSSWDINQVTSFYNFMNSVTLSTANYDALLIAWDAQGAMSYSGVVNFGGSKYTSGGEAESARASLVVKWGGIADGGAV